MADVEEVTWSYPVQINDTVYRFLPNESWPHLIPLFMFFPSTALILFLTYVVVKKSPATMNRYKYVILLVTICVYQFDVATTLITPTALPRALGAQYCGPLGYLFPQAGNTFTVIFSTSTNIVAISLVVSFVYREYSLIHFKATPIEITCHIIQHGFLITVLTLNYVYLNAIFSDHKTVVQYLKWAKSYYNPDYATYCITLDKLEMSQKFSCLILICVLAYGTYILKAIIRIQIQFKYHGRSLSPSTIRQHKMLLRSLIVQMIAPLLLITVPQLLLIVAGFAARYLTFIPKEQCDAYMTEFAMMMFVVPSFYSFSHVFVVLFFTKPYRLYTKQLFTRKRHVDISGAKK